MQKMSQQTTNLELNKEELLQAREWVKDCMGSWRDLEEEEDVDMLSDAEIIRGIKKNFSGGIAAFKASCE